METKVIDADDLIKSANDVENAMKGLSQFICDHMSSTDTTIEKLNSLSGLTEAVVCLTERHSKLCEMLSVTL